MTFSKFPRVLPLALCLAAGISAAPANATLLGVDIGFPRIAFNSASTMAFNYDAGVKLLTVTAEPTLAYFSIPSPGEMPSIFTGMVGLSIRASVDSSSGLLLGGVIGHDFTLTGTVSRTVNSVTTEYSGTLLTGEVTGFGFLESGTTDQFDFRFKDIGGELLPLFNPSALAADITSEESEFGGGFTANFKGQANGIVGLDRARPVPDATGTLPLLAMAMVGLMTARRSRISRETGMSPRHVSAV